MSGASILGAAVLLLLTLESGTAYARRTPEEQAAFFADQRQARTSFESDVIGESDSKASAIGRFNVRSRQERADLNTSIASLPAQERQERLAAFNAKAREDLKAFQASLGKVKKNKLEQTLSDFDAKSLAEARALMESLEDSDARAKAEALRQFQNVSGLRRARLQSQELAEITKKRQAFKAKQAAEVRSFLEEV